MPITITLPSPGVGPGYVVHMQSDFVGPFPLDYRWVLFVRSADGTERELQWAYSNQPNPPSHTVDFPMVTLLAFTQGLTQGENVNVEGQIQDPSGQTIDIGQTTSPKTWDGAGMQAEYQLANPTQATLSPQEHTWLDQTQQAVNPLFQALTGAVLSTPIGGLIAHPDTHLMNQLSPCQTLVGNGTAIPPQNPALSLVYGVVINFEFIPPGFGYTKGIENRYSTRIAQFGAVYETLDATHGYLGEIHDVYQNNTQWLWSTFNPVSIQYSIAPGCQVNICWLAA